MSELLKLVGKMCRKLPVLFNRAKSYVAHTSVVEKISDYSIPSPPFR